MQSHRDTAAPASHAHALLYVYDTRCASSARRPHRHALGLPKMLGSVHSNAILAAGVCTAAGCLCSTSAAQVFADSACSCKHPDSAAQDQPEPEAPAAPAARQEPEFTQPMLCDTTAVRTFNPWVEACVARGSATANPPTRVQRLQHDLAALPLWFEPRAQSGGAVLLQHGSSPSEVFLGNLVALGIGVPTPTFVSFAKGHGKISLGVDAATLPLMPWGWSPRTQELYSRLNTHRKIWYTGEDAQRQLFGKAWAAGLLKRVLARNLAEDSTKRCGCLPSTEAEARYQLGVSCKTIEEVCDAIESLYQANRTSVVVLQ